MIGSRRQVLQRGLPFVVFGALWSLLVVHLSVHWSVNPQYNFGWFGPLLCGYLFLIRWLGRPAAEPARSGWPKWVFWTCGIGLLPTWMLEQPNPDWRLVSWLLTSEVAGLSLCAIYFAGGRSWLRHFAPSICLIFTTVPWPGDLEVLVTHGLMKLVTAITVACLNVLQIHAIQHGNLVEVGAGTLGIDEACSGIRSLQATLLVALFLGELHRATWPRRIVLVFGGVFLAFICNVGRAFLLGFIAARDGLDAISTWHDSAGFVILGICFVATWGLAHCLSGAPPKLQFARGSAPNRFPRGMMAGLAISLFAAVVGTEIWYRAHESSATLRWSFEWPTSKPEFSELQIPEQLGCDEGHAASWTDHDATRWTVFFLKWAPGPVASRIQARLHRPENCFPGAGYKLETDRGIITLRIKDLVIPFHALDFNYEGRRAHVFFCLWEDHQKPSTQPTERLEWTRFAKLESVLLGERNLGQQVLEVVISGCDTHEEAEAAFRRQIDRFIRA
ncbi:MAG: exosortase/archaeosortase family protein [Verrucomicrobia bacterium]|nr:exosortase/archaeosortase family protein [Verrucomicrobiota bacterium]